MRCNSSSWQPGELSDLPASVSKSSINSSLKLRTRRMNLKIPRPDKESVDLFQSLVPKDDRVTVRPMFGNISAFVNGNMFFGVFGNDLFVRLSSEDQLELLKNKGSSMLEPMKGKPMKDYVVLPKTWRAKPETLRSCISKSLEWSTKSPAKKAKK